MEIDWAWFMNYMQGMVKPVLALVLVLLAVILSYMQRLGLGTEMLYSIFRAFLQLTIIGFVLKFVFNQNNAVWILFAYLFMVCVAGYTVGQRATHVPRGMYIAGVSILAGTAVTMFLLVILNVFEFSPFSPSGEGLFSLSLSLHMQQQEGPAAPPPPPPAVASLLKQKSRSPDAYRGEAWLRRKGKRRSIDRGFGFVSPEIDQRLSDSLPALGLYYTVNTQFYENSKSSTTVSECDSPSSSVGNHSIFDPGDNPQTVKTRLRQWAQVVACSVRHSSS